VTTLRVLSYNVLSLRRGLDGVAAVIRAAEPDVVCVQEAPRFWRSRRRCRALAAASGLVVVTGGRPAGAVLLLARGDLRVVERRSVKLPWHPPKHRRGVALGVFDVGGTEVVVGSTHLSLFEPERVQQARAILALATGSARPAVLAGDVNEDPDGPAFTLLSTALRDAYAVAPAGDGLTSTAEEPRRRIDAVFVDPRLRVLRAEALDIPGVTSASDHRPVLAVLDVPTVA
jgi:endonuclease/exonuclease/phosphatase family metal-dependent hydrolase